MDNLNNIKIKEGKIIIEEQKKKAGRPRIKPIKEKKRVGRPNDPNKVKLKLRKEIPKMTDEEARKLIKYLEKLRSNNIEETSDGSEDSED